MSVKTEKYVKVDEMDTMDAMDKNVVPIDRKAKADIPARLGEHPGAMQKSPYDPKANAAEERGVRIDNGLAMKPIIESLCSFEGDITQLAGLIKTLYSKYYEPGLIPTQVMHLKDEVNELFRAVDAGKTARNDNNILLSQEEYLELCKDTIQDEIADILIMTLGLAGHYGMSIEAWLWQKMNFNIQRGNHL